MQPRLNSCHYSSKNHLTAMGSLSKTISMKLLLKSLFLLFIVSYTFSQESRTFQVLDQKGEPVPFAHVRFKNTMNGTICNVDGEFKITAPNELVNPILVVSSIGYRTNEILFDSYESKIIRLTEDVIRLNEVVVIPQDYERELLYKAIRHIPDNYPSFEERHYGFARESVYWEETPDDPVYVAESTMEATKNSYEKKNTRGHVKVSEGRRYVDQEQMDKLPTTIIAGSHHINRFDAVGLRKGILSNDKNYELEIVDTLRLYDENLYKLNFKKGEDISGYLLIIDSTFAIVEAYYDYKGSYPLSYKDASRRFMNYKVNYERSEDNKWRYKHSKYHTGFKYGKLLNLKSEFVSTQVEVTEEKIPYLDRIHYNDVFLDNLGSYDSSFWDNYTIIIPDQEVENLFKQKEVKAAQIQVDSTDIYQRSEAKNIRVRAYYELSYIPINVSSVSMSFSNDVTDFSFNQNAKTDYSINLITGLSFEVANNLWTGIRYNSTFRNRRYNSLDLEIAKDFNLNKNGRPVLLSPKLVLGHQWVNQPIGSFEHNENYEINGKKFDSGKTNLYLHERGFHLSPTISIGFEKNKVVRYFLSFGTNIFLTRSTGVVFNEDEQFFLTKKNEFLKEGGDNLNLSYDDPLLSLNWTVSFGIYLSNR